jgi:hypothetical protein
MRNRIGFILAMAVASLLPTFGRAQVPLKATTVVSGLSNPVHLTSPPGDRQRLFIVEQTGAVKIFRQGALVPTPFLHLGWLGGLNKISYGAEQGLFNLAFHPNYAQNGYCYVSYTNLEGNSIVERYQVSSSNPDQANPASGTIILGPVFQPQSNHNGGALAFGADGKLYIGLGDGGGTNDQGPGHAAGGNAQFLGTLLGKILRLDVDLPPPYVPFDNPFVGVSGALPEIWSLGWRNPWRLSFDRLTGDMYIGDVGQSLVEEIDFEPMGQAGRNYGWSCMEGAVCTGFGACTCAGWNLEWPLHQYLHAGGCFSVTGGVVYRGCAIPALQGTYFFADYCQGTVWSFQNSGGLVTGLQDRTLELSGGTGYVGNVVSFGEDADGEVYLVDVAGVVLKLEPAQGSPDCNQNGTADACDLALGISQDANGNGIPDECECPPPQIYCNSQLNSQGCTPGIGYQGLPALGSGAPFWIATGGLIDNTFGLLFYGHQPANAPFQGGWLCVSQPLKRTPPMSTGGGGASCTGQLVFDFNAWVAGGFDPVLTAGVPVFAQFWSRDLAAPSKFHLTDAIGFLLCP